mmetsp:Transcript_34634/g.63691  ORF Transcript_34634/g.63691 Transcript_34634/m.63691 type:complete len:380 (+) Transcript_34634:86-1225(+)
MDFATLSDVTPLPQNDGPVTPVCSIAYTSTFIKSFDYLRALLKADERSERAFDLTTQCLKLNPANYTVWHFRRRCLIALSGDGDGDDGSGCGGGGTIDVDRIEKDLEWTDNLGGTNPKNYQLWYHRRALLEFRFEGKSVRESEEEAALLLSVAQKELEYVDKILEDDSKNYHAWSHRQWIIRTLDNPTLWSTEIQYSHSKILSDPRNNSAWSQRWFALHEGSTIATDSSKTSTILSLEKAKEEANYALSGAKVDPYNESPWRYLIGIVMEQRRRARRAEDDADAEHLAESSELVRESIKEIREMKRSMEHPLQPLPSEGGVSVSLLSALVDLLEIFADERESSEEAKALFGELAVEDPVRRKYWRRREREISKKILLVV